jgi:hypothetical protein
MWTRGINHTSEFMFICRTDIHFKHAPMAPLTWRLEQLYGFVPAVIWRDPDELANEDVDAPCDPVRIPLMTRATNDRRTWAEIIIAARV